MILTNIQCFNKNERNMKICLICQDYCNHITRYCPKVCCKICGTLGHVNIDCKLGIVANDHQLEEEHKKHSNFVDDSSNDKIPDVDNAKKFFGSKNSETSSKQLQEHGLSHSDQNVENSSTSRVSLSTSQIFEK